MSKPLPLEFYNLYDGCKWFLERLMYASGWINIQSIPVEGNPKKKGEIVGLTINAVKYLEKVRIPLRLSFLAVSDGKEMALWDFHVGTSMVLLDVLNPYVYLQHIGKGCLRNSSKAPGIQPEPENWVVTNPNNIQALLEGYDKLARLLGYPVMFTALEFKGKD
jgi:hypothetical protein